MKMDMGTPAIFIPLRDATRGDQLLNASMADETGMSVTLEKGADAEKLGNLVEELISDPRRRRIMGDAASAYPAKEAADRIAAVLMEYAT